MTIYMKTELGQRAFKERAKDISARQRAAFILIDGKRPMQAVIDATAGMGIGPEDFEHLAACGFVTALQAPTAADAAAMATPPAPASTTATAQTPSTTPSATATPLQPEALYMRAYPIATQLVASLGLRGVRLNLAVESANGYEQLLALVPRIRDAVGAERCAVLEQALRP